VTWAATVRRWLSIPVQRRSVTDDLNSAAGHNPPVPNGIKTAPRLRARAANRRIHDSAHRPRVTPRPCIPCMKLRWLYSEFLHLVKAAPAGACG
jgi:hypothetical protein